MGNIDIINDADGFTPELKALFFAENKQNVCNAINFLIHDYCVPVPGIDYERSHLLLHSLQSAIHILVQYDFSLSDRIEVSNEDAILLKEIYEIDLLDLYSFLVVFGQIRECVLIASPASDKARNSGYFDLLCIVLTGYVTHAEITA